MRLMVIKIRVEVEIESLIDLIEKKSHQKEEGEIIKRLKKMRISKEMEIL